MIIVQKGLQSVFIQSSGLVQNRGGEGNLECILSLDHDSRHLESIMVKNNRF